MGYGFEGMNTFIRELHLIFGICPHSAVVCDINLGKRSGTLKRTQKALAHTQTQTHHDHDRCRSNHYTEHSE